MIVIAILYIVCLYVSFVFTIRRLHDRNNTGWLSLLMLIPAVNLIFMIYLFAAKGTEGNNDYGPQRPTPGWERVLGWIYIILIPLALFLLSLPQSCLRPMKAMLRKAKVWSLVHLLSLSNFLKTFIKPSPLGFIHI